MNAGYVPMVRCDRLSYLAPGSEPGWLAATAATLAIAMAADGWRPGAPAPEGGQKLTRGMWEIDLSARLSELGAGALAPKQWRSGCRAAGIDTLEIVLPARHTVAAGMPDMPDPLGERASSDAWWRNIPTRRFVAVFLALAIMLTAFYLAREAKTITETDAGEGASSSGSVDWADGRSGLPGGYVRLDYDPSGQDWEAVTLPNNQNGVNDQGGWFLLQRLESGVVRYGIATIYLGPSPSSQKRINERVGWEDAGRGRNGKKARHTTTRVDGRTAYNWLSYSGQGHWARDVWVYGPERSYRFSCSADAPTKQDLATLSARCNDFVHSAKFSSDA